MFIGLNNRCYKALSEAYFPEVWEHFFKRPKLFSSLFVIYCSRYNYVLSYLPVSRGGNALTDENTRFTEEEDIPLLNR